MARSLGEVGKYGKRIRWNRLGSSHNWLFELSTTDAVNFAIVEMSVDITSVESI
jgi:hypothetical protein